MRKNEMGYVIEVSDDANYSHLVVTLVAKNPYNDRFAPVAEITMQSDDDDRREWYGMRIKMSVQTVEQMNRSADAVRKVARDLDYFGAAGEFLTNLRDNFTRYIRDCRTEETFIEEADVMPPEYREYFDSHRSDGYVTCKVLARDEDEARDLLTKEFANTGHAESLVDWIKAGRPTRTAYRHHPPTIIPWSEILPAKLEDLIED